MEILPGDLLKGIDNPSDLKKLKKEQLAQLSDELRQYIIDVVSIYGGHLAASLGVVELLSRCTMYLTRHTTGWSGM